MSGRAGTQSVGVVADEQVLDTQDGFARFVLGREAHGGHHVTRLDFGDLPRLHARERGQFQFPLPVGAARYRGLGQQAWAIDRRALLVSALAYVLAALTFLFDRFGAVELNFALTALVIGSALLTLSAFWTPIRARVVEWLPGNWQARLPVSGMVPA